MKTLKKNISCPTCQKKNTWKPKNLFRPFCSERCKLIDLGTWANEEHRIAGDPISSDQLDSDEEKSQSE